MTMHENLGYCQVDVILHTFHQLMALRYLVRYLGKHGIPLTIALMCNSAGTTVAAGC